MGSTRYAERTSVPAERSRNEIEAALRRFGADQFVAGWEAGRAVLGFRVDGRHVRMWLPLPQPEDPEVASTPSGNPRSPSAAREALAREERRRWRALALVVEAELTAVADGISTVEREFLADVVLPDGRTLGEWAGPQVEEAYRTGTMPTLLPGAGPRAELTAAP